jgi:uncharacterized protein
VIGPILLAISWFLLFLEGRGLGALGVDRPRRRLGQLALGFVFLGSAAAFQQLGLSLAAGDPFVPNAALQSGTLLNGLRFTVNSVLYEELVFRGYLLYQAVRFLGPKRAVLIDAAAFGVYHWFSYGVIGNPVVMAYVFLLTGAFGLMWARAFVATGSVAAPIGLHLGWNSVGYLVFSAGPLGAGLLLPASGAARITVGGWLSVVLNVLLPVVATGIVLWYCRRIERHAGPKGSPGMTAAV